MKLYGALASPYVARVVMFAALKGIDLPLEAAPGGMGSATYKALNPTGKIPILEVDGQCIAESEVICEYLESVYPESALLPRDQAVVEKCAGEFAKAFSYVEFFMSPDPFAAGPFAAGKTPTITDCALTPFIVMLKRTVFPFFDEVQDPTTAGRRLTDWWQAIQDHPGCRKSADEYDQALEEFLKWLWDMLAKRNAKP